MEYFTRIQEPKKLRISLMSAARDSIIIISMLEGFSEIKKEKEELVLSLREDFKELNSLCKQLAELIADEKTRKEAIESIKIVKKEELPKLNVKLPTKQTKSENTKNEETKTNSTVQSSNIALKQKTEVDRLEYTLAQIEQKLADLQK